MTEICPTCDAGDPASILSFEDCECPKYPCPECGVDDQWVAYYMVGVHGDVVLAIGDDGEPRPVQYEYNGTDDDCSIDLDYRCGACETVFSVGKEAFERLPMLTEKDVH